MDSKQCNSCGETKSVSSFYAAATTKDKLQGRCKACAKTYQLDWLSRGDNRERQRERTRVISRARKRNLKVSAEHVQAVQMIYEDARLIGYEVDHIVPVSKGGRHEPCNLQIVTKEYNRAKRDKLWY